MSSGLENPPSYAVGIDLGTTNSCVAVYKDGKVQVIPNRAKKATTPSVVAFDGNERLIGESAVAYMRIDPQNTIYNAKRFIGQDYDEQYVQDSLGKYPFPIVKHDDRIGFKVKFQEKVQHFSPEEISAAILGHMKNVAEEYLEQAVKDAVITVPAYFSQAQKEATKNAGEIAGLNVLRIINEPTSATLAYCAQRHCRIKKNLLVFDLGGGTFDLSFVEVEGDSVSVKSTYGDSYLGGDDFTRRIFQYFKKEISCKHNVDITHDHRKEMRLHARCEAMKISLSNTKQPEVCIELDSFLPGNKDFESKLSRAEFEDICKDLFHSVSDGIEHILEDGNINKREIDEIILVGGSTKIPKIQQLLSEFFDGKQISHSINPDEAVAYGAALQAAILSGVEDDLIDDLTLLDVNPISIGMRQDGGEHEILLKRNSPIPCSATQRWSTVYDNQTAASFDIYEGESSLVRNNKFLGSFVIKNLPPKPEGKVKFQVVTKLNSNGLLTVNATETHTNNSNSIVIENVTKGRLTANQLIKLREKEECLRNSNENVGSEADRILGFTAVGEEKIRKSFVITETAQKLILLREALAYYKNVIKFVVACGNHTLEIQMEKRLAYIYKMLANTTEIIKEKFKFMRYSVRHTKFALLMSIECKSDVSDLMKNLENDQIEFFALVESLETTRAQIIQLEKYLSMLLRDSVPDEKWKIILLDVSARLLQKISSEGQVFAMEKNFESLSEIYLLSKVPMNVVQQTSALKEIKGLEEAHWIVANFETITQCHLFLQESHKQILSIQELENSDDKVDKASYLLDQAYEHEKIKDFDICMFGHLRVIQAKIFFTLLRNPNVAKEILEETFDWAKSYNFSHEVWYEDARSLEDEIKKYELENNTTNIHIRSKISIEIKTLEEMKGETHISFIQYVLEKYPPKHRKNWEDFDPQQCDLGEALKRAAILYHPDKVILSKHGEEYKLLCEEICTKINNRWNKYRSSSYAT